MLFVNMELKKMEKDPTNQSETYVECIWNILGYEIHGKMGKGRRGDVLLMNIESERPKTKEGTR